MPSIGWFKEEQLIYFPILGRVSAVVYEFILSLSREHKDASHNIQKGKNTRVIITELSIYSSFPGLPSPTLSFKLSSR